jgi:hypothetical protein
MGSAYGTSRTLSPAVIHAFEDAGNGHRAGIADRVLDRRLSDSFPVPRLSRSLLKFGGDPELAQAT